LMCTRCGAVSWFGDTTKLAKLRVKPDKDAQSKAAAEPEPG